MDKIVKKLRELNEEVPIPLTLPAKTNVKKAEDTLNTKFHPDYIRYLLEISDVVFGILEPAQITDPDSHNYLIEIAQTAWTEIGIPKELLPICEDNGDYYCMNQNGEILFWSHNGLSDEKWISLSDWIQEVWINES